MKSDFVGLFDDITTPKDQTNGIEIFNSNPIPWLPDSHVGKDSQSRPAIILSTVNKTFEMSQAIALENLRVEHNVRCKIFPSSGPPHDGRFSLIHCTSADSYLQVYFLQTMYVILKDISDGPTTHGLSLAINKLAELFHALNKPPSGTTQGLWAELFLIVRSSNPHIMMESWHSETTQCYDFSFGNQSIEVKCSGNRVRQHYFTFEQAYPSTPTSVLVASMFVEPATNGTPLGELWDQARDLALGDAELRIKIERVCLNTLGSTWHGARQKAYDEQLALNSLAFFDINDIPRVSKKQPNGVSDIRFRSDLSRVRSVAPLAYGKDGLLYASCVPSK